MRQYASMEVAWGIGPHVWKHRALVQYGAWRHGGGQHTGGKPLARDSKSMKVWKLQETTDGKSAHPHLAYSRLLEFVYTKAL